MKKIYLLLLLFNKVLAQEHHGHHQNHIQQNLTHKFTESNNGHKQGTLRGMYGPYPMSRESSGTAWQPDSSKNPNIIFEKYDWLSMLYAYANLVYDHQGGKRGDRGVFSENYLMFTTQKTIKNATFAFRTMFSLEPATIPEAGFPLLLQTGETANGITPLIDHQHQHNFFMELAVVYTYQWAEKNSVFMYFGIPGEPALGPTVYIERFSALYNPEAPITHHWLDSTHIQFGVATLGLVLDKIKFDASIFTGAEPNQFRWGFNTLRFDSYCGRISLNPHKDVSLQISAGFLKSPEELRPEINIIRATASLMYTKTWDNNIWSNTLAWGCNFERPGPTLNGFLAESTLEFNRKHMFFGQAEAVAKNELFVAPDPRAEEVYHVGKISLGYIYEFEPLKKINAGIGLVGSIPLLPSSLKEVYGNNPFSYMVFLRIELRE